MKTCFKCHEAKDETEFYIHKRLAGGRLNKCKECTKRDVRANRLANLEMVREYDRCRGQDESRKAAVRARAHRYDRKVYQDRYIEKHPDRRTAVVALSNAVRDGRVVKPTHCTKCGSSSGRINGHHKDFSKPLEVTWLCTRCLGAERRAVFAERRLKATEAGHASA